MIMMLSLLSHGLKMSVNLNLFKQTGRFEKLLQTMLKMIQPNSNWIGQVENKPILYRDQLYCYEYIAQLV